MKTVKKILLISFFLIVCSIVIGCRKKDIVSNGTEDTNNTELIAIFDEYKPTLDGAYAEKYAYDLYEAYKKSNSTNFIKTLSSYDLPTIEHIIKMLVGTAVNNDSKYAKKEFSTLYDTLHDDKNLSDIENFIVYDIYTWLLYYLISL
jgi:hypothetical protein